MGSSMSRLRSSSPSSGVESVPDDTLTMILLLVSPHPTCLPCLAAVCKRFNRVITDRAFLVSFRRHHLAAPPPLLGFFHDDRSLPSRFVPVGDSPAGCVSAAAFNPKPNDDGWRVVDSRHSRVLLLSPSRSGLLVWEPMSSGRRYIRVPRLPKKHRYNFSAAAVLCEAGHGADYGWCGGCPFAIYFVVTLDGEETARAYVYSSEHGKWEEVASIDCERVLLDERQGLLLGNVMYWTLAFGSILALDLNMHDLYEIELLPNTIDDYQENAQLMETEGGALSLAAIATGTSKELTFSPG